MNSSLFKKILSTCIMVSFLSTFTFSFAQTQTPPPSYAPVSTGYQAPSSQPVIVNGSNTYTPVSAQYSQANTANSYTQAGSFDMSGSAASSKFGACISTGALGNFVQNQISSLVGSIVSTEVPIVGIPERGKSTGLFGAVSWDQMGWCMVNSVIEAIGDATVNWINSGFQGNPVFVTDPGQFLTDVADMQAGVFLNELSHGFLCSPLQSIVRVNLASNYNGNMYGPQCSFTAISGKLDQFMTGQQSVFSWNDWMSYTQNPYNNGYGATLSSKIELDSRIASALGVQSTLLSWGGGFLSSRDPKTGAITSPGSVIEKQVNDRLGSGQRRLEIADEFDEITNALVSQLVRVALSEMTQTSSGSSYGSYDYSTPSPSTSVACPSILGTLQLSSTGTSVSNLQKYLQDTGYFSIAEQISGEFATSTKNAVIRFQVENNIVPADGFVGTTTKQVISTKCLSTTGIRF